MAEGSEKSRPSSVTNQIHPFIYSFNKCLLKPTLSGTVQGIVEASVNKTSPPAFLPVPQITAFMDVIYVLDS